MLVPRHPERFDPVAALCRQRGLELARRSEGSPSGAPAVYLGDTMGELPVMLAAADVAFVGGSLVDRGGHNLLEPAALGLPVLTGPSTFNFAAIHRILERAGGCRTVADAAELGERLAWLLRDREAAAAMGANGRQAVECRRGARDRMLAALEELLPD